VAADLSDVVSVGECDKLVSLAEVEDTLGLFGELVFHDVGRSPLVELVRVRSDSQVDWVRALALSCGVSKVLELLFSFSREKPTYSARVVDSRAEVLANPCSIVGKTVSADGGWVGLTSQLSRGHASRGSGRGAGSTGWRSGGGSARATSSHSPP